MVNPPAVVSLKTIVSSTTTVVSLDGGAAGLVVRTPHEKNSWKNVEEDSSYPARHRVRARCAKVSIRDRDRQHDRQNVHQKREEQVPL